MTLSTFKKFIAAFVVAETVGIGLFMYSSKSYHHMQTQFPILTESRHIAQEKTFIQSAIMYFNAHPEYVVIPNTTKKRTTTEILQTKNILEEKRDSLEKKLSELQKLPAYIAARKQEGINSVLGVLALYLMTIIPISLICAYSTKN